MTIMLNCDGDRLMIFKIPYLLAILLIITDINLNIKNLFYKPFILYWGIANKQCCTVSSEHRRDSATHVHVSVLPETPLPSRLPHNMEQSSKGSTVDPHWLSILNIPMSDCTIFLSSLF